MSRGVSIALASMLFACGTKSTPSTGHAEVEVLETCGGATCGDGESCVRYFAIADVPAPAVHACEQVCTAGGTACPRSEVCAMVSDGPGFVCRPREAVESPTPAVGNLADIVRLWSRLSFAHPQLAYRDVDWNAALVRAVPAALAARSPDALAEVAREMVAAIGDPATELVPLVTRSRPHGDPLAGSDASIVVVDVDAVDPTDTDTITRIRDRVAAADRIVFDLQRVAREDLDALAIAFTMWATALAPERVALSATRTRVFRGFPSAVGGSGGYVESFENRGDAWLAAERRGKPPRVAFVVGPDQALPRVAVALRQIGVAIVVATTALDARALAPTITMPFGERHHVRFRSGEPVQGGALVIAEADAVAADPLARARALLAGRKAAKRRRVVTVPAPLVRAPKPRIEGAVDLPELPHRVLVIAEIWGTLDVFYPYRDLLERWDGGLEAALHETLTASTEREHFEVLLRLTARAADGHTILEGPRSSAYFGDGRLSLSTRFIEGAHVVTRLGDSDATSHVRVGDLRVGDVIVTVDGEPTSAAFARLAPLVAASTPGSHRLSVAFCRMQGRVGKTARLELARGGERLELTLAYVAPSPPPSRPEPTYRVLDEGFGYVDLARLTNDQVPAMFAALAQTPAIVFDMRGYPNSTAWTIAPVLDRDRDPTVAALFTRPRIQPGPGGLAIARDRFPQEIPPKGELDYAGTTVMLVDEHTQSQAEHTGLFFEAANGTRFVGTPSSGANGDITARDLSDGTRLYFTGQAVTHANGQRLQRVGLVPEVRVEPTLAGLRRGDDEVLTAAVEWLRERRR